MSAGGKGGKGKTGTDPACPVCGRPRVAKYSPFCSSRCAQRDLGRWLKGSYRIPTAEESGDMDGDMEDDSDAAHEIPDQED